VTEDRSASGDAAGPTGAGGSRAESDLDERRSDGTTEPAPDHPVIELQDVVREYETGDEVVRALAGVSMAIERGEFLAVIGPSGSGKSTMLNLLGLLDAPTAGVVRLDGRDVTDFSERERTEARKNSIGFVFQDFYLIPTLTARENVELPTMFDPGDSGDRAVDLLRRVGLGDRLDHTPDELSGGQKQRVAIARSLVNEPAILLADEPTGNLDRETGKQILAEFERLRETGVSIVAVTHDPLVTEYTDRTVELVDGRIVRRGEGVIEP